ncbi:MAG: formylglycine-generating enzyme family protein [Puniceicoccaceae bacterium]
MDIQKHLIASAAAAFLAGAFAPAAIGQEPDLDLVFVEGGTLPEHGFLGDFEAPTVESFLIGRTEVTGELYWTVWNWALENGYSEMRPPDEFDRFPPGWFAGLDHPMSGLATYEWVLWMNALTEYVNELTGSDMTPAFAHPGGGVYRDGRADNWNMSSQTWGDRVVHPIPVAGADGFRLPTVSEHYHAAAGGNRSRGFTYAGSDNPFEVAWMGDDGVGDGNPVPVGPRSGLPPSGLHPAGVKQPNELGIHDMSGNVSEWTIRSDGKPFGTAPVPNGEPGVDFAIGSGGSARDFYDPPRPPQLAPVPPGTSFGIGLSKDRTEPVSRGFATPDYFFGARIAKSPSPLPGGEEPVEGEPGIFRHPDFGAIEWLDEGKTRLWSHTFGAEIVSDAGSIFHVAASPQLGRIQSTGEDGWMFSKSFGWIWGDPRNESDGWFYSGDYGWLKNVQAGDGQWFTWSVSLQSWGFAAESGGFETLRHGFTGPTAGNEGWILADRYGFTWTGGGNGWLATDIFGWLFMVDDVWFWSQGRDGWFGVVENPDGGVLIWDASAGEFL